MPKEEVVIVAKTRAGKMVCLGAVTIADGKSMRLRPRDFPFWEQNINLDIGSVLLIKYSKSDNPRNPHHSEDVIVKKKRSIRSMQSNEIVELLNKHNLIVQSNDLRDVFRYTGEEHPMVVENSQYYVPISNIRKLNNSVGFWCNSVALCFDEVDKHYRGENIRVKYVGFHKAIPTIEKDSIVRLSTSGMWKYKQHQEFCSYLQISGWFL